MNRNRSAAPLAGLSLALVALGVEAGCPIVSPNGLVFPCDAGTCTDVGDGAFVPVTDGGLDASIPPDAGITPPDAGLTDTQACDMGCTDALGCGISYLTQNQCVSACLQYPPFISCMHGAATSSQCNDAVLCLFVWTSVVDCGGDGGYPMGTQTCAQTAVCEAGCNLGEACICGCEAGLDPSRAVALWNENLCGVENCSAQCNPPSTVPVCDACLTQYCQTAETACASQ